MCRINFVYENHENANFHEEEEGVKTVKKEFLSFLQ